MVAFVASDGHILSMGTSIQRSSEKTPPKRSTRIAARERAAAARIAALLSVDSQTSQKAIAVVTSDGDRVELPAALAAVVRQAAELVAEGHSVAVASKDEILSTQAAADLLNVSRQYLVRLVDAGELPVQMVGSHRRLKLVDVLAYRAQRDSRRASTLSRLTTLSEDLGGYDLR